jgi:hypothetical protein
MALILTFSLREKELALDGDTGRSGIASSHLRERAGVRVIGETVERFLYVALPCARRRSGAATALKDEREPRQPTSVSSAKSAVN